jgi:WD40 repeat protein
MMARSIRARGCIRALILAPDVYGRVAVVPVRVLILSFLAAALAALLGPAVAGTPEPRLVLKGHDTWVFSLAFSPDGKTLVSGDKDGSVRLWDVAAGKTKFVLAALPKEERFSRTVHALAFSPDGKTLATGGDFIGIRLWDPATGKETAYLNFIGRALAIAPDGKTLATGGGGLGVNLYDLGTLKERKSELEIGHLIASRGLAYRPDGQVLVSGAMDGTVTVRSASTAAPREKLTSPDVIWLSNPVAFAADGKALAYVDEGWTIRVRVDSRTDDLKGHAQTVHDLAFRADGRALASAGEDGVMQWDWATRKERIVYGGKGALMYCLAYSPDGKLLAAAGIDGAIRIWDVTEIPPPGK